MTETCPGCGHRFGREQGYWLGAVIINTAVTFALFIVIGITLVGFTWPDVPWRTILVVTLVFNGLFPVFFYPFSKTIWVAVDLAVRPVETPIVTSAGPATPTENP